MILEGDHVLQGLVTPTNKRGVSKGGRGKKDKRKKGRALRPIVPLFKHAGIKPSEYQGGRWE